MILWDKIAIEGEIDVVAGVVVGEFDGLVAAELGDAEVELCVDPVFGEVADAELVPLEIAPDPVRGCETDEVDASEAPPKEVLIDWELGCTLLVGKLIAGGEVTLVGKVSCRTLVVLECTLLDCKLVEAREVKAIDNVSGKIFVDTALPDIESVCVELKDKSVAGEAKLVWAVPEPPVLVD